MVHLVDFMLDYLIKNDVTITVDSIECFKFLLERFLLADSSVVSGVCSLLAMVVTASELRI